jgi:hypothetical protein
MALVWTDATGDRQIQPLPPFKGIDPPARPLLPVAQSFPGLPVGPEPPCDRSARTRAAREASATP